ncbi:hypothetical protein GCM10027275_44870 [Rhabdobacter roseus]|uniref:Uncharacterized protein n=1 Tax=Rhabdobacter roseus TaxID=1655419 RepID=A0A840TZY4_9BACT|nr:hypothetical protein [Rhabdobacter roseus]MBB5286843.1 hypothetical protein [Rhabdobacter roseus]
MNQKYLFSQRFTRSLGTLLLSGLVACLSCQEPGTCETSEMVNFRGINFAFPLTGAEAYYLCQGNMGANERRFWTDNIIPDAHLEFRHAYPKNITMMDTLQYLKDTRVFGVTISLKDTTLTDQAIIEILQKQYPGEYKYIEKPPYPNHYLYQKGCLAIVIKKEYLTETRRGVPGVSFCYGLSDYELQKYILYDGDIFNLYGL